MILVWASDELSYLDLPLKTLEEPANKVEGDFFYYTPAVHKSTFALPAFMLR